MQIKTRGLRNALLVGFLTVVPVATVITSSAPTSSAPNTAFCVTAELASNPNIKTTRGNCPASLPTAEPTSTPTQTPAPINFNNITWTAQAPSNDSWSSFASSGNGQTMYAAKGTRATPMRTLNGGASWEAMPSAAAEAYSISSTSKSGTNAILASQNGQLKYTNNFGATWTDTNAGASANGFGYWYAAAISGDGQTAVAGNSNGKLYVSIDGAQTWVDTTLPAAGWRGAAISDDGSRIVVGSNNGRTFTSSNRGTTWSVNGTINNAIVYGEMDSSSDGKIVYSIRNVNSLFVSNDWGVNFTQVTSTGVPTSDLRDVSVSDDGSKIVIGTGGSGVHTSIDGGVTWKQQAGIPTGAFIGVASSADGSQIVSGQTNGKIYVGKYGD